MEKIFEIVNPKYQCEVCELSTKGNSYGVSACTACASAFCSAFLRMNTNDIEPCKNNQQCSVVGEKNRKLCRECRLRKSLDVGMRHDIFKGYPFSETHGEFKMKKIEELIASLRDAHQETSHRTDPTFDPRTTELMKNVSHICCAIYSVPPRSAVKVVPDAIKGVEEFGRKLLCFVEVPESNQDTLLKEGVFGVLLVRLARTFNSKSNTLTCWNGKVIVKGQLDKNERSFWFAVFDFAEMMYNLNLSDDEVSLFCLVIIFNIYHQDKVETLIAKVYYTLMDILTDLVKQNRPEDSTNFFTAFNILMFRILHLKNIHLKILTGTEKANPSRYSPMPHQYTEYSDQLAVSSKGSPTFLGQQSRYQPPFDHRSTASVDMSVPNLYSRILSNPIVPYKTSFQQGFSMPPAKNAELKRIGVQNEDFVPQDRDSSSREGIESSSEFSRKKSYPSQDQKIIDGKKLKRSEDQSGSSTDFSAIYNEGLQNMRLYQHHLLKHTSYFSNPVDRPPIAKKVYETFPSGDMPLCLSSNSITTIEEEDSFIDVVSVEPVDLSIPNPANPENYHQK